MSFEELQSRIGILEDIEAIRKLKANYSYLTDTRDMQEFANLFVDDAVMDFGTLGRYEGKAEVIRFVRDIILETYSFLMHMNHNPIIEVKGEKATGEWYFEVPVTHAPTNRAVWINGKYEEEYVKVGGEWKFKTVVGKIYYNTPYDEGWVKTKMYE